MKHKNLSGTALHYPLGRSSEGALDLVDDVQYAYQIKLGSSSMFNISTANGAETVSLGNSTDNPKILCPGTGNMGIGTLSPSSPNGNQVAVQLTGTSVGLVLDSTNGSGVPWEMQHNSGDMKIIYDGANTLGGGAKTAIALDAEGRMRLGSEVSTPSDPGSGNGGFVYVKSDGKLYFRSNSTTETDLTASGSGITAVVDDTSPQLGGNLDCNGNNIAFDNDTSILDEHGQEQITFLTTSSAVNQLTVTNAAAGGNATAATSTAPIITGGGTTANCDLALQGQGTGTVTIRSRGTNSGTLSLNNEANTFAVNITAPLADDLTADYTLTLPVDDGAPNQVLETNGSGVLSWATPSSGGGYTVQAKSAGFTAAVDYYYVINSSGGTITVTLPNAAATTSGKTIGFKARHGATNAVTLNRSAGGNIDGAAANLILSTDMAAVELICDGTDWWIKS
tara:strand:- start:30378 stop:31730 length:1353 start_codon:yes stop_codon:yes gene_type:complete